MTAVLPDVAGSLPQVNVGADDGPFAVGVLDLSTGELSVRSGPDDADVFALLTVDGWPVGVDLIARRDGRVDPALVRQLGTEMVPSDARAGRTDLPFAVVVCTRDRPERLAIGLPRLAELIGPDRQLIVVDNAPSDRRTREVVAAVPSAQYVVEPVPGLARARNRGLAVVDQPFVVFTDDDVDAEPTWVDVLSATFDHHPGAVCVSGSVLPSSLTTEAELRFQEFGGYQRSFDEMELHLALDPPPSPLFPFHPRLIGTGANMAFRTEALGSIGGFDPALGAGTPARGGEDIDVAVRLLLAGHLVVRNPAAVIWHASHPDLAGLHAQLEDYGCGLAAALTKFATNRRTLGMMLRRATPGIGALFSASSPKNDQRSPTYPTSLRRAEWRGLRAGPAAYRRSKRTAARVGSEHDRR